MKVNILGADYTIEELTEKQDPYLSDCAGYCDKTSRRIVIKAKDEKSELDDFETYRKTVLRHEIIHAFLYESGLHNNFEHHRWGHDETMIDWVAVQFPKMIKAFEATGCL